jgi:hypothetical protein
MKRMKMNIMTRRMMALLLDLEHTLTLKLQLPSKQNRYQRDYSFSDLQLRDSIRIQDSMNLFLDQEPTQLELSLAIQGRNQLNMAHYKLLS